LPVYLLIEQIVDTDIDGAVTQAEIVAPGEVMLNPLGISLATFFDLSARAPRRRIGAPG
jgi:hypothetical protein